MALAPILVLINGLSSIHRFSMEKLTHRESVLEHVGMVSIIALALATEVAAHGSGVNVRVVLTRAVCHDVDEVITGDIARPTKHASRHSKTFFEELSKVAMIKIRANLFSSGLEAFGATVIDAFDQAKVPGPEGAIVALADVLAVVAKVREEVLIRGNRGMVRHAHTARRQLLDFRKRIAEDFSGHPSLFLDDVVSEAVEIMDKAIALDDPDLLSQVEVY